MTAQNGDRGVPWVRGEIEPCHLCKTPVHTLSFGGSDRDESIAGHPVGHPMMETYEHYACPNEAIQQRVRDLLARLYDSDSVCWALYRIEAVGDRSVDADADRKHYETRWNAWKEALPR